MGRYIRRISSYGQEIKLYLLFNMLLYIGIGVLALVYNLYLYSLDLREDYIGAFGAIQTMATAAAALTMGRVLSRFGLWRCVTVSLVGYVVIALGLSLFSQPGVLLVLAALFGVTLSYLATTTMPFIIEWGRLDQRQDIAALTFSLISLASTFGSLIGGAGPWLAATLVPGVGHESAGAYRWTLVVSVALAALAILPLLRMTAARAKSPKADVVAHRAEDTRESRRQVRRDVAVFVGMGAVMSFGMGMVLPFFNVYMKTLGASDGDVGLVFAAGGLAAAVIGLSAPAVSRRFGALWAVFWVRLSIVPCFLLLIITPSLGLAILTHLVRSTSISMAWPIDSTFISEILPARARANVFALRSGTWNLGWSIASLIGGAIIVHSGYELTFVSLIVFTTISVLPFVTYYARHPLVLAGQVTSAIPIKRRIAIEAEAAAAEEPAAQTQAA